MNTNEQSDEYLCIQACFRALVLCGDAADSVFLSRVPEDVLQRKSDGETRGWESELRKSDPQLVTHSEQLTREVTSRRFSSELRSSLPASRNPKCPSKTTEKDMVENQNVRRTLASFGIRVSPVVRNKKARQQTLPPAREPEENPERRVVPDASSGLFTPAPR